VWLRAVVFTSRVSRKSSAEWSSLVREFEKSGMEHVAFCASRDINVWTFRKHLYDLRGASKRGRVARSATAREPKLVRVDVETQPTPAAFFQGAVDLAFGGVTMRVAIGTDPSYVALLIAALRASC
jgi:hypothetical protein